MLSLEAASYETPQRVEFVARTLLGMTPPPPERVIALRGYAPRAPGDERRPAIGAPTATPTRRAPARRRRGRRAVRNLDPAARPLDPDPHGHALRPHGPRARRHRLGRVPHPGRGRRPVARARRAPAPAPPPHPARSAAPSTTATARRSPRASRCRASRVDAVEMLRGIEPNATCRCASQQYAERIAAGARPARSPRSRRSSRAAAASPGSSAASPRTRSSKVRALSDRAQRYPIAGLTIEGEGHRFYPNRELAGPLLGFVSPDGDGQGGPRALARARAQGPRLRGARPARSLGPPALLRGPRGRAGARRPQRLPDHRQGHPVHRRARARRGA